MALNWAAQQAPPPYSQQYPNQQQAPGQQWPPNQQPGWGQAPPYHQPPPYTQPPPYNQPPGWGNANPYWQQNMYAGPGAMPKKRSSSGSIKYLLVSALVLLVVGGIAFATNGKFFSGASSAGKTPVVTSFTTNPATITTGQTANLAWDISGATSVSIDQGIGTVTSSGTKAVSPTATTTYTLTATGSSGSVTAKATVTVGAPAVPVITSFTASPETITSKPTTLQWNVTGATSVSIAPGIGNVSPIGSTIVSPTTDTTYTLTATNEAGSVTASAKVTMAGGGKPLINSFTVDNSTVRPGELCILRWSVSNATVVVMDHGFGPIGTSGNKVVSPTETDTYVLTATNGAGDTTASVTITVK